MYGTLASPASESGSVQYNALPQAPAAQPILYNTLGNVGTTRR